LVREADKVPQHLMKSVTNNAECFRCSEKHFSFQNPEESLQALCTRLALAGEFD
jgi:hypothetical protein